MAERAERIASELLALLGTGRQVAPISEREPGFHLVEAYDIAARIRILRERRGESVVGRKIGFTNTTIWRTYGVSGPMWNYMFNSTVSDLLAVGGTLDLCGFAEPRIEPEIVLHLAKAPRLGMNETELIGCVDWIAHGFEIVQSVFPRWAFRVEDTAAAFGLHGALLIGERHDISADCETWRTRLASFDVALRRNDVLVEWGHAHNVLGGPLSALRFLVEELARYPGSEPLAAGEIVTTGTLTDAQRAVAGDFWTTEFTGLPIDGIALRFQ